MATFCFFGGILGTGCCALCSRSCKKDSEEKDEIRANKVLNGSLLYRKNDWWVESGGPPVTNGGRIMNQLDMGILVTLGKGNGDPIDAT